MKNTRDFNEANERIKRTYLRYLRNAKGHSENTLNKTSEALLKLETATSFKSFSMLNVEDAEDFRQFLTQSPAKKTGKPISQVSRVNIQDAVRAFVHWLADQPGFRSRVSHSFAEYFGPLLKDVRVAHSNRIKPSATPEQALHAFRQMPDDTIGDRRSRALFAFMVMTAARIDAVASLKIGHVDMKEGCVFQDGAQVRTKLAKTFTTWFLPVEPEYEDCFSNWSLNSPKIICSARLIHSFQSRRFRSRRQRVSR